MKNFFPKSEEFFSDAFESFVLHLFSSDNEQNSDDATVKMFRYELENQLHCGKVRLFQNQKSNQELSAVSSASIIYHENHMLLIPVAVFDSLCSIQPVHVKRALLDQDYLSSSNQLYITKKTIYPPGSSGKRMDVYAINDDIVDSSIIEHLTMKNRLQFSRIQTTSSSEHGLVLGHGIHNQPIIWSYEHPLIPNAHLFLTGRSGTGKTTFIIHIMQELCKYGKKAVVFDISDSYIHHPKLVNCSDIYTDTLPVNPLRAYSHESKEACCQRVTDNLSSVFHLDDKNYYILSDILNEMYTEDKIVIDMAHVKKIVGKNKTLLAVFHFAENFCSGKTTWEQLLSKGKAVILSMKQLRLPYEKATEFLLHDLYSYMEQGNDKIFAVMDEIQNMIQSDTSAVIKILSQGREKGLDMITATQSFLSIPRKYKSMFLQSGLSVFFQPEVTAADLISKFIHAGSNIAQVSDALKKLGIGECLIYGSFENCQNQIESDILLYCNCISEKSNSSALASSDTEISEEIPSYEEHTQIDLTLEMYNKEPLSIDSLLSEIYKNPI